jgi:endonuclease G
VNATTPLTGACPTGSGIIDFVGYGAANCSEGPAPAAVTSNTTAVLRRNGGCFDTNNNSLDFNLGDPTPRNSASPAQSCAVLQGAGTANPSTVTAGGSVTLTVVVSPAPNPPSTGVTVAADLSLIGGSPAQPFSGVGNTFTLNPTVAVTTPQGLKLLPVTFTDEQGRTASATISLTVLAAPSSNHIMISQVYGGGGNTGATFSNDFVELYNPTSASVTITGWSLQYSSAAGATWTNKQPLGGFIGPGEYYLVSLGSGNLGGAPLPVAPNIAGDINLSGTTGKIALVSNSDSLVAVACPIGADPDIVDFIGYGTTANCREGAENALAPSNITALLRNGNGATDTDQNRADFTVGTPSPRRTAPIVELGPWVANTDPISNGSNAPYDATITIDFNEPVDVAGAWFDISCPSGQHNSATIASYNGFKGYHITPNVGFTFGETCTVTIFKDQVHDQDLDDGQPDTDTLLTNYTWSFTVVGAGAPAPYPPSVHLTMGNPSNATTSDPNNYLMEKPTYSISYNKDKGIPNWVSWHLDSSWFGSLARVDTFRADPAVPPDWYRVQSTDYFSSGFDRGHMTPNADRDNENRIPINQETYLMTNMVPQAPDNNQGPWAAFENELRTQLAANGNQEMYVISGPQGVGGSGSNGGTTTTLADGKISVPAFTWKVVLVLPKGENDISRATCSAKTIAILMPNQQGIRNDPWQNYLTTVDAIEALTGYDFFSNLSEEVQSCLEAGLNGTNPPGAANQSASITEDSTTTITLHASQANAGALTFSIVGGPANGALGPLSAATCANGECTATVPYTPGADYSGADSFTFKASDGTIESNVATVSLSVSAVNDAPVASPDAKATLENTTLSFPAGDLTANDAAGPANESGQSLTLTEVSATANTFGAVALSNGVVMYLPAANYSGAASFNYQVCDNGLTNGSADSKCAVGVVNVMVNAAPDTQPPTINCTGNVIADFDPAVNGAVVSYTAPVGTDNRPGVITAQTAGLASGAVFPLGSTINTFTATDAAGNMASCSFKVTVALTSVVGLNGVTISGASYADGYDSTGGYPATKGSLAKLLSNSVITVSNSGVVSGSVRSTQAGVVVSGASRVTGDATAGTTVSRTGSSTIGGTITNNAIAPIIALPAVGVCTPPSSISGLSGTYSYSANTGDLTLSGANIATVANGDYCFRNLTLTNSAQLKVNGPVVIRLSGTLNVGGASNLNNTTGIPGNLRILSSYSGATGVIFNNGASSSLTIYAPQTGVSLSGTAPVFGGIAAKSIVIGNSANFHYDVRQKSIWPELWDLLQGPQ